MLSQAMLHRLGHHAVQMYGDTMEPVTWYHRDSVTDVVTTTPVCVRLKHYSVQALQLALLEPRDLECRLLPCSVAWVPTHYDEFVREDGTRWRVVSIRGGPRHAWWVLQTRQVGIT